MAGTPLANRIGKGSEFRNEASFRPPNAVLDFVTLVFSNRPLIASAVASPGVVPPGDGGPRVRVRVGSCMDISTSLGIFFGMIVMTSLILMGGDLRMFVDYHAAIVIFGGSFAATLIRFPLSSIFHGLPLGAKYAFTLRRMTQRELVDEIAGIAEIARKQGPVGLEKVEIDDPFLAKGIRFIADGYDAAFIRDNLERDRDNFLTHLDEGQKIYRAIGDCAPAFGMIGTLIGMVQMFANMTDPSKLGPLMAVALLATFYGAALANLLCLPLADKLHLKLVDEEVNRTLIIDGIMMIRDAKSPTLVREMLLAYLPEKHRHQDEAEPVPA
jgi:chemotaxis protein MotA